MRNRPYLIKVMFGILIVWRCDYMGCRRKGSGLGLWKDVFSIKNEVFFFFSYQGNENGDRYKGDDDNEHDSSDYDGDENDY
jgi:hypothetical protein